jgi:hypothetical protein
VVYLLGFVALMLFLVASHEWLEAGARRLGVAATVVAVVGTMLLGGDLWFETFAVPWLADRAPRSLDADPTVLLALGAVSSYFLFAVGWVLFGVACLRAHVPVAISAVIIVGGALGYRALLSPWVIPLGVGVAALGAWLVRSSMPRSRTVSSSSEVP